MCNSILDNDLYKFTMQNAVVKLFPRAKVKYVFINRDKTPFPKGFAKLLQEEVNKMSSLQLTKEEKLFIEEKCYYLDPAYIDFLNGYKYDPREVKISQSKKNIKIEIEGYWYRTILWEVPILALVSELYFKETNNHSYNKEKIISLLKEKIQLFNKLKVSIADFGTRRRYSFENHDTIIANLKKYGKQSFTGSSNVYLAKKYNVKPIGTHAHEWFMFHAAKYGFKNVNVVALNNWADVYKGDLGIALSDTFTSDVFFKDFDKKLAKLFDGVRHDSGNPIEFMNKTIQHYKNLNIDPQSKVIIFSDSLDPEKVEEISNYAKNKIKISFGIGTNLTNDVGVTPLNIVIKMDSAKPFNHDWTSVIKLSDEKGKYSGNKNMITQCKKILSL